MKKLICCIKPFKLQTVLERLPAEGVLEVCVSEVRGYGQQKGHLELYREGEFADAFLPKARVELYCTDEAAVEIERLVVEGARTGRIGDGKCFRARVERMEIL
jgi:nitrogen regulatory protein P-II 1